MRTISKIGATFLQGFKDFIPSKTYLSNKYELTITNQYLRINKKCFNYFKGSTDIKIAYNKDQNALAIINTYHNDPNLLHISLSRKKSRSISYNSVTTINLLKQINNCFPQLKLNEHYTNRIFADKGDIGKDYIIFHLDKNHIHQFPTNKED